MRKKDILDLVKAIEDFAHCAMDHRSAQVPVDRIYNTLSLYALDAASLEELKQFRKEYA